MSDEGFLSSVRSDRAPQDSLKSSAPTNELPARTTVEGSDSEPISFGRQGELGTRTVRLPGKGAFISRVPTKSRSHSYSGSDFELDWLRLNEWPAAPPTAAAPVRIGDAFSGGGIFSLGVDEGLRAIGRKSDHVFGLDFDKDAIATFRNNFPDSLALHTDIAAVVNGRVGGKATSEERSLQSSVGGSLDILVAGPPCQGNSDLNNHTRRNDPKNSLYFSVVRLAELLSPAFIVVENVPGVVHDRSGVVERTADGLAALGYHVSARLIDLALLGVPQKRKRFVLVASMVGALDIGEIIKVQSEEIRPVSWAISDLLGAYSSGEIYDSSSRHSAENRRRIDVLFDRDLYELPNSERPPCHRDKLHSYTSVYGRMRWDEPSPTITGGFGSTGQGRFVHPLRRRTLTPHEACRLQFIPDFYRFPSSVGRRAMQQIIGNAAPPKLSQAIVIGAALKGVLL